MVKKVLMVFAIIVFVICFILAIYDGVTLARVVKIVSGGTKEEFDFGLFLIGFMKDLATGLVGGGVLLGVSKLCPEY